MFWSADEVDLSDDATHYAKLTSGERHFVDFILAFFSASDGFVTNNLDRFLVDVPILEARYFFEQQKAMENIHAHMYSELIESIIPDAVHRRELFQAVTGMPIITKITNYIAATTKSEAGFAERLLRMACVEGILFTGCFCAIYHFQQRGIMRGLAQSNGFIARDEALHTLFAVYLYGLIEQHHALRVTQIHEIVREFVVLAQEFINEALPEPISGMNKKLLCDYIEAQADNLVDLMGVKKIYETTHQFTFMFQQNLSNRTNFFERKVTDYMKISGGTTSAADDYYDIAADF
jgi:ribonucleotide reductase beta subunit family protein with ferritin-like domain